MVYIENFLIVHVILCIKHKLFIIYVIQVIKYKYLNTYVEP